MKLLEVEHVPQCPIAGDATEWDALLESDDYKKGRQKIHAPLQVEILNTPLYSWLYCTMSLSEATTGLKLTIVKHREKSTWVMTRRASRKRRHSSLSSVVKAV